MNDLADSMKLLIRHPIHSMKSLGQEIAESDLWHGFKAFIRWPLDQVRNAFPIAAEAARLAVTSWRYGREEIRGNLNQPTPPAPSLEQLANDRIAAEATLLRRWTRWL